MARTPLGKTAARSRRSSGTIDRSSRARRPPPARGVARDPAHLARLIASAWLADVRMPARRRCRCGGDQRCNLRRQVCQDVCPLPGGTTSANAARTAWTASAECSASTPPARAAATSPRRCSDGPPRVQPTIGCRWQQPAAQVRLDTSNPGDPPNATSMPRTSFTSSTSPLQGRPRGSRSSRAGAASRAAEEASQLSRALLCYPAGLTPPCPRENTVPGTRAPTSSARDGGTRQPTVGSNSPSPPVRSHRDHMLGRGSRVILATHRYVVGQVRNIRTADVIARMSGGSAVGRHPRVTSMTRSTRSSLRRADQVPSIRVRRPRVPMHRWPGLRARGRRGRGAPGTGPAAPGVRARCGDTSNA